MKTEHIKEFFSDPSTEEYVKKTISLVTNIPLEELENDFKMLPLDENIEKQIIEGELVVNYVHKDTLIVLRIGMK